MPLYQTEVSEPRVRLKAFNTVCVGFILFSALNCQPPLRKTTHADFYSSVPLRQMLGNNPSLEVFLLHARNSARPRCSEIVPMIPYIGPEMIAAIREGFSFGRRPHDTAGESRARERERKIILRPVLPANRSSQTNDVLVTVKLVWLR
jgi:hypothetical protein